ncbi:MAG: hypothetical protein NVSMB26_22640 [Beijerinckiaceae bacterium]
MPVVRLLIMLGLLVPVLCQAAEQRTISIKGFALLETPPDIAQISVGVNSRAAQATAALDATSASARQVINYAKQFGVAPADISTTSVTLMEAFKFRNENGRSVQESDGYTANNTVEVNLRDLTRMGLFLRDVVNQGATRISNIHFKVADPEKISDDLMRQALENARHQAAILAESTGAKLGPVLSISYPPRVEYSSGGVEANMPMRKAVSQVPIEAGLVTLQIAVDVTWALE